LRAECDALQTRVAEAEEEARICKKMQEKEAGRNSEAYDETMSIMRVVRQERLQQEAMVQNFQFELQRSEDKEAIAKKRFQEAEDHAWQERAAVEQELRDAKARSAMLENGRRSAEHELIVVRTEVHEEGLNAQSLKQSTIETEERARNAAKEIDRIIAERDRNSEMQASMAEEQDRSIRRLEELLKDQGDQLRHERQEHSKGLEQMRSSASLSASKTQLFEEQVSMLRCQLKREQDEVRASERAWASDRATLLAAAATCAANSAPPNRTNGGGRLARRKNSPHRSGGVTLQLADAGVAGSAGGCPCKGATSSHLCPWHGNRVPTMRGAAVA
jgi:hypothetical protein